MLACSLVPAIRGRGRQKSQNCKVILGYILKSENSLGYMIACLMVTITVRNAQPVCGPRCGPESLPQHIEKENKIKIVMLKIPTLQDQYEAQMQWDLVEFHVSPCVV